MSKMKNTFLYIFLYYCLLPVFVPACSDQPRAVSDQKMTTQKLVKIENTWCLETKSEYYNIVPNALRIKFKPDIHRNEQEQFLSDRKIAVTGVDPAGIYEIEVKTDQNITDLYARLYSAAPVEYVQVIRAQEADVDRTRITEIIFNKKRFVKKNQKWYLRSAGDLYEIIPYSLSLKFKDDIPAAQRQEFLNSNNLKLLRQNRLGIYDLELPQGMHALDLYFEIHEHPLLEFVEVNTLGSYN
jgi:hypothetical protein